MEITQRLSSLPREQQEDKLSNPDSKDTKDKECGPDQPKEEGEQKAEEEEKEGESVVVEDEAPDFSALSEQIDEFLGVLHRFKDAKEDSPAPPQVPEIAVEQFVTAVENEITKYESGEEELPLLDAINRISKLHLELSGFSQDANYYNITNKSGCVLHHAMCFLEDLFFSLLETGSSCRSQEASPKESNSREASPAYPKETVEKLRDIAAAMISAGYGTECCEMFSAARNKEVEAAVSRTGYEKGSIDDVVKMPWESLEGVIATWIKSFRHFVSVILPAEHDLCNQVFFSVDPDISTTLFHTLAGGVLLQLLVLPEAVAMTKRSAEKLFKVLDIYDALRDAAPTIDSLLPDQAGDSSPADELTSVRFRLGDAAVSIFCDLEGSVKSDAAKTPVPGGAVHPLTRYVMNYLKYACEYKNTLDLVFHDHHTPFSAQLMELMDLLDSNLEAKSKLYKDPALSNIFLMNNGRYIAQKIKGSSEINMLLGETWYRKRSSNLRQYHKNYQRETWAKVLACFKDEGLTAAKGGVQKPVVKERMKNFNSLFEEIHRTQSAWVVSDEQLQSELRVSVSAVVVPAYRSFLGRFAQCLTPGRQTEKYVKFGAEDLESYIDELFDGKVPAPVARRRT